MRYSLSNVDFEHIYSYLVISISGETKKAWNAVLKKDFIDNSDAKLQYKHNNRNNMEMSIN